MTNNKRKHHRVNVTSAKLSRKLLALLGPEGAGTADHHYWIPYDPQTRRPAPPQQRGGAPTTLTPSDKGRQLPAWSCGALASLAINRTGDKQAVDALLSELNGSETNEKEVIARLGALILGEAAQPQGKPKGQRLTVQRESWPTQPRQNSQKEPFHKRFTAWWNQRPWAKR